VAELARAARVNLKHITSPGGMWTSMFTGSKRDDTKEEHDEE